MNKIGLIALLLLCLAVSAIAGWEKIYGGSESDVGYSVAQTSDGGYIVVGYTYSFGTGMIDVYLIKTDLLGDTLWTRTYGGSSSVWGYSVAQTSDGGFIIAGRSWSAGSRAYLIKTDSSGDSLWAYTYTRGIYDVFSSVEQTTDGGYIMAGFTSLTGGGYNYAYLVRTDTLGDTLWTRAYRGIYGAYASSVKQTSDGGFIIAGATLESGDHFDVYLVKTDDDGDTIWTRTYDKSEDDEGYCVQQTSDEGYIIVGTGGAYGANDVYLIKTDSSGDTLWTQTYDANDYDVGHSVEQTTDGGYIIAGYTNTYGVGSHSDDVYIIKTDSTGDTLWTRTYGGSEDDWGHSVAQTTDGGYIVAGWTESFGAGGNDVYLIKTDSLGYTGIEENNNATRPEEIAITAYPNPFNSAVKISICQAGTPDLPIGQASAPEIEIFDINGRQIAEIPVGNSVGDGSPVPSSSGRGDLAPTNETVIWSPDESVGSGIFFIRVDSSKKSITKRVVYLK